MPPAAGTPARRARGLAGTYCSGVVELNAPSAVLLARRLRQETTMSLKWIAERLQMGSWTYVSNLLRQNRQHLCK